MISKAFSLLGALCALTWGLPARATSYDPGTTVVVYVHGFSLTGYSRAGVFGDDEPDPGIFDDVTKMAGILGQPTWQAAPTAPNQIAACTYYGDTAPAWYTAQDLADDAAAPGNVPRYALRVARYIRHVLDRAPAATAVNIVSGSFGTEISRYLIEHDLLGLASSQMIARWNTIVGVTTGNWAATTAPGWLIDLLGASPDIYDMDYRWVDGNISSHQNMNSPLYGPMIIAHWIATDDLPDLTALTGYSYPNDGTNLVQDEYFWGYSTAAALHPATDGTLQMPGRAFQHVRHSDIRYNDGMWAGVAAASQSNKRVTITLSRIKALTTSDSWLQGNGEFVFSFAASSPMAATLYGAQLPLQDIRYEDGISPLVSLAKNATKYPGAVFFDQVVPPGETRLDVTFSVWELDNFYTFYRVIEDPTVSNKNLGVFSLSIPVDGGSTVTVSNGNVIADLTTTIRYVY